MTSASVSLASKLHSNNTASTCYSLVYAWDGQASNH